MKHVNEMTAEELRERVRQYSLIIDIMMERIMKLEASHKQQREVEFEITKELRRRM